MGIAHVTVTFEHKSGLARDRVINSFTFAEPGDFLDPIENGVILEGLRAFYNDVHAPAARSIASWISPSMSRIVNPVVRFYDVTADLSGTPAGSPEAMFNMAVLGPNTSAQGLPAEVALALSFHADFGADVEFAPGVRPRARDRGRVFIGPLGLDAVEMSGGAPRAVPSPGVTDSILQAGKFLRDTVAVDWQVWSRRAATTKPVTTVSVDDAFDIQRRRGERPTARLTA